MSEARRLAAGRVIMILLLAFTVPAFIAVLSFAPRPLGYLVNSTPANETVGGYWYLQLKALVSAVISLASNPIFIAVLIGASLVLGVLNRE